MSKIPSDPDRIANNILDLTTAIYEVLLDGSYIAREYFDILRHEVNTPLAANITRYHARERILKNINIRTAYFMEDPPNNGIVFRHDWFQLKVLKGRDGEPPTATKTARSQRFYTQVSDSAPYLPGIDWLRLMQSVDWEDFAESRSFINLILCWETDPAYNISQVQLMCPRKSGKYKQGVQLFWKRIVPHPVLGIVPARNVNDTEEVDDLPVYFEDAGEEGEDD